MIFNEKYNYFKNLFESSLNNFLFEYCQENLIGQAVKYSIVDAGKRIRPVLCYAVNELLGGEEENVKNIALAIEMIHSYSLVHDDLPCMDNDDYRRGKYSTHKKFGENIGVLAGDALLNLAVEVVLANNFYKKEDFLALKLLFEASGLNGMIKGQVLDLCAQNTGKIDEKDLNEIYFNKTAKLIIAPILIASIYNENKFYSKLKDFGYNLGMLFQIIDDIMDYESDFEKMGKTPNKDETENKLTSVKVYTLIGAKQLAEKYYSNCLQSLEGIDNNQFLIDITNFCYKRRF